MSVICLLPTATSAQTLDEAVTRQLQTEGSLLECSELIDGDIGNLGRLRGELLNICSRGIPAGGTPSSGSQGGGAATPTSTPNVVKQRLSDASDDEDGRVDPKAAKSGPNARTSDDGIVLHWSNGFSLFFSTEYESTDREVTRFEAGYESDVWRVALGGDYRLFDKLMAGMAVDYSTRDGDFEGGGDFEDQSIGVLLYATAAPLDNISVQMTLGYARGFFDRERVARFDEEDVNGNETFSQSGEVEAEFEADRVQFGTLASYDYFSGNLTLSPRAGFNLEYAEFGGYDEAGNSGLELHFYGDDRISVETIIGAALSGAISTPIGVLLPQVSIDWKHEFKDDQRKIDVSFVDDASNKRFAFETENPDRDYAVINAGISASLRRGISAFGNYRVILEHSFLESHAVTLGGRIVF